MNNTPRKPRMRSCRIGVEAANIPAELIERPQWVLWRITQRYGQATKRPFQVNGRNAKTNDPATWTTFESVRTEYVNQKGRWSGIGYVFAAVDPFGRIKLRGARERSEESEISENGFDLSHGSDENS